ncbi:MAG: mechanosensitive ion channel family protein [Nitrospinae bacterium]|nr:mechanosensitive ion channel family protein [Nitrospinota bacterium]MBL7020683.1 mechanosensitive ion channel family protein [Nitrospinaceae bacterium]
MMDFKQLLSQENIYIFQAFLVIFIALIANFFQKRVFKSLAEKAKRTPNKWDDAVLLSVPNPLSAIIWATSIAFAGEIIHKATGAVILEALAPIRDAIIIAALAWFLVLSIRHTETNILSGEKEIDPTTLDAISKLGRISVVITAALMILQTLGFSISGVLAFGGVGGIAIGFAAKDLLSNFFGGLFIYMDRPFAVGDWIRSPDREMEGTVEKIGWRVTLIRTFDKRPLYIPNSVFSQVAVENPSRMLNRRIKETIGIRYSDADKMEAITNKVKEMLKGHPEIDTDNTLMVNFNSFAPCSLDFFIYTFTKTTNWVQFHSIKQDILLKILKIIEDNGAEVAFPTSTIHLAQQETIINPETQI